MEIAGVIVLTVLEKANPVMEALNQMASVTTYGVYKENHIVAVFEGETPEQLENISNTIMETVPGVLGIYPAYVNSEGAVDSV